MKTKKILVVGDIMLDHYTYVESNRRAAEADIPVWDELEHEYRFGGAANVAFNLACLSAGHEGVQIELAGIASKDLCASLKVAGLTQTVDWLGRLVSGEGMVKRRYVDNKTKQILMRSDNIREFAKKDRWKFRDVFEDLAETLTKFDAIVISDYNKGTLHPETMEVIRDSGVPFYVDSKRSDLSIYRGAKLIKLNESEHARQAPMPSYHCVEELAETTVVTLGGRGAAIHEYSPPEPGIYGYQVHKEFFPTDKVEAVDVTGCGDTFLAGYVFANVVLGEYNRPSVRFANKCASQVVQKFGTSVASLGV